VSSRVGSVEVAAEVTTDIQPGVVSLPHGWGHGRPGVRLSVASAHAGVSINDLVDDRQVDALTGTAVLNGTPVEVVTVPVASAIAVTEA
jgi:anaerobic selenocysteine-containing dehydrogenase